MLIIAHVKNISFKLHRSISKFRANETDVGRSGRSGPSHNEEEALISRVLALDDSLRLNSCSRDLNNTVESTQNGQAR